MIYQVKDSKKIPLGAQFDSSWEIEYDRDLSSQLSGKSEWTATEDCWFQYNDIWVRQNASDEVVAGARIRLNGVSVARTTSSSFTTGGNAYTMASQLLMKKGDTVKIDSTAGGSLSFGPATTRVFPIHRILSKEKTNEFAVYNNPKNQSIFLIADKPQGIVRAAFVANTPQTINIIWDVASSDKRFNGTQGGDRILCGDSDSKYPGKHFMEVANAENIGAWFFTSTDDCNLTVETR